MKRFAWYLVISVMALAACATALDRQARRTPELSAYVPEPFRGFAGEHLAVAAMQREQAREALAISRQVLRERPMPAEHLRIYAQAAFLSGKEDAAAMALTLAGQRGWRDPVAQAAVAAVALAEGNMEVAAQRVAALWATHNSGPQVDALTRQLLSSAEGRQAMAQILAAGGSGTRTFINTPGTLSQTAEFADTLRRAEKLGANLPCDKLSRAASTMAQSDPDADLASFTPARCGSEKTD